MANLRSYSDIVKGNVLMVFYDNKPIGFATSHSVNITTNTTTVTCKDSGDYPGVIAQNINWEIQAENLFSDEGQEKYLKLQLDKEPVEIVFAKASNYDANDEKGVLDVEDADEWTYTDPILKGDAIVTSFSINAPSGDNATMSVTFTGVGPLTTNVDKQIDPTPGQ